MSGMLELIDSNFKTTMINMLSALMGKVDNIQDRWIMLADGNSKKEPKRNASDQKHCNRNKEYL